MRRSGQPGERGILMLYTLGDPRAAQRSTPAQRIQHGIVQLRRFIRA
jgi:hypothetical protein